MTSGYRCLLVDKPKNRKQCFNTEATILHNSLHPNKPRCKYARSNAIIEIFLKLKKLTHEVEIRWDDRPSHLDKFVGISHGHQSVFHQVCNDNCGRTWYTSLAVNKQAFARLMSLLCWHRKQNKNINVKKGLPPSFTIVCLYLFIYFWKMWPDKFQFYGYCVHKRVKLLQN